MGGGGGGYIDEANLHGRVLRTGLGVGESLDGGVDIVHVVDDVEPSRSCCVAAPESDVAAVTAPAEAVATVEILFVHPVERAVDDGVVPVGRQLSAIGCLHVAVLKVDVVFRNVGHVLAVG